MTCPVFGLRAEFQKLKGKNTTRIFEKSRLQKPFRVRIDSILGGGKGKVVTF